MTQTLHKIIRPNIIHGQFNKLFIEFVSYKYGEEVLIQSFGDDEFINFIEKYSERFEDSIFPVIVNRFSGILKVQVKSLLYEFNVYIRT